MIRDKPVPKGTKDRAKKTLPDELKLRPSPIDSQGHGIFAKMTIPARVRFGPYEGEKISLDDSSKGSGYAFEVSFDGIPDGNFAAYFAAYFAMYLGIID